MIWESRVRHRPGAGAQPEGVLVMAPRGMEDCVKSVMVATGKGLEGRGIAVHFVQKAYDVLVVSLYCHVGNKEVEKQKYTEKLWN